MNMQHTLTERDLIHADLMAHSAEWPNTYTFACILASWYSGQGAMPAYLGLSTSDFQALLDKHFSQVTLPALPEVLAFDPERLPEGKELRLLLLGYRGDLSEDTAWMADIVVAGCMASDHLWQDLGLWCRADLTALMERNFPTLAAKNDKNMKWKKFLYKQLCDQEGIYVCRAPSCEVCTDYKVCFGPEE